MNRSSSLSFLFLVAFATACGSSDTDSSSGGGGASSALAPTVTAILPIDGAVDVPINGSARADFSVAMDCDSLTTSTFTLAVGAVALPGTVICQGSSAVFWPAAHLPDNGVITATVTTGARSADGVALEAPHAWSFTTGVLVAAGVTVNLGKASDYVILAKSAISTVPTSAITGDIGLSPAAASFITGFSLTADSTNVFATSPQVTGKVYAADYAVPTPSNLTEAVSDMELAFTDAAGRAPGVVELGAGNIGGMTLEPGVYKWGTGLLIPTDVTLAGSAEDVWIFQVAKDLTVSSGAKVTLSGGALSKNVFWQVAGSVEAATTAHLEGSVLTLTSVTLRTGASLNGRLLAQTAANLDGNTITMPTP